MCSIQIVLKINSQQQSRQLMWSFSHLKTKPLAPFHSAFKTDRVRWYSAAGAQNPPLIIRETHNQSYCTWILTSYLTAAPQKMQSDKTKFCEVLLTWKCDQRVVLPSQDQNRAGRWCKARDWHEKQERKKNRSEEQKKRWERIKLCVKIKACEVLNFSLYHPPNLNPLDIETRAMFPCLTLSFSRLAEPNKSQPALQCALRVNIMIEKCVSPAADMQCDFDSYLFTRGGDKRGWLGEAEWEKGSKWKERETEGDGEGAQRSQWEWGHQREETDAKRQKRERGNDGD